MKKSLDFIILIAGLIITFISWKVTAQVVRMEKEQQTIAKTEAIQLYLKQTLSKYEDVLISTRGLFSATVSVNQNQFEEYIKEQHLFDRFSGIYSLGYFSDPQTLLYAVGKGDGQNTIGVDSKSDEMRNTFEQARDSGQLQTTKPVVWSGTNEEAFVSILPLYDITLPINTVTERKAAIKGYLTQTVHYDDLIHTVVNSVGTSDIEVIIHDEDSLIYSSLASDIPEKDKSPISGSILDVGGRTWRVDFFKNNQKAVLGVEDYITNFVLITGICISILLFGVTFALSSSETRANDLATRMTKELRDKNQFIEEVLAHLPVGIAVNNIHDGQAVYMNSAFEKIYGWGREYLVSVEEFFKKVYPDPTYRDYIKKLVTDATATGDPEKMNWEDIQIQTHDGTTRFITARNIPLPGQNLMVSTVLDTTARKLAENRLIKQQEDIERIVAERTSELQEEKARLSSSIANLPLGFVLTSAVGNVLFMNNAVKNLLGLSVDVFSFDQIAALLSDVCDLRSLRDRALHAKASSMLHKIEFRGKLLSIYITPIFNIIDDHEECIGFACVFSEGVA